MSDMDAINLYNTCVAQSIQTLLATRLKDYQPIYHLYNIETARARDPIPAL